MPQLSTKLSSILGHEWQLSYGSGSSEAGVSSIPELQARFKKLEEEELGRLTSLKRIGSRVELCDCDRRADVEMASIESARAKLLAAT